MSSRRAAIAALLKDLTPGDVHTNTSVWPSSKKGKRRRLARLLAKLSEDPGLYVGRRLTPACEALLTDWWASLADTALDTHPHVTVVFSRVGIAWTPDQETVRVPRSQFLGFETLGKDKALVLRFKSPALQRRWSAARSEGATWEHAAYSPHMTFFYLGSGYDSDEYRDGQYPPLPPFDLEFGPEVMGPLKEDVFKYDSVDAFLTGQDCLEGLAESVHNSWWEHNPQDSAHGVPYAQLAEKGKQVDRDAVLSVLRGVMALGFSFTKSV